jgi:threonine dehydratase
MNFDFPGAAQRLTGVASKTELQFHARLSRKYSANIYLKREDLQPVRSYKIRGAYNMISSLTRDELQKGIVCASAGNHAQGVAFSCKKLQVTGVIFMPVITPRQKVEQTAMWGEDYIQIRLIGDTFDDCARAAREYTEQNNLTFIPPFDHEKIIEGQGTVALEILSELKDLDYIFVPVGGGGLASGCSYYFHHHSPDTKVIGLNPEGSPSMIQAFEHGHPVTLEHIDRFVDGAAVKRVGDLTYSLCREYLHEVSTVPEGKVCTTILELYNRDAIVVEPAGALSVAALDFYKEEIYGKTVVCVISGGNNDIDRMQEIKERSLQYEGLKHYFLIRFAQRPGALKEFVNEVLGSGDDITRFEYMQKTNKETGPALVGVELSKKEDYHDLIQRMKLKNLDFSEVNKDDKLFGYLI